MFGPNWHVGAKDPPIYSSRRPVSSLTDDQCPGLCSVLAESDVEIVWWKFRVVKTHCHLFLMSFPQSSNAFSLLTLCEENGERGGDSQPGGFRSRMGASLRLHQCA